MGVIVTQTTHVEHCNECPLCHKEDDRSCCFDSFDEPNYDFYCQSPNADNSHTEHSEFNNKFGKHIFTAIHWSEKCEIPDWCPFKKKDDKRFPSFEETQREIALNK